MSAPKPSTLTTTALSPLRLLQSLAFSPLFTGPLLLILLRGPPDLRQRLLSPFQSNQNPLARRVSLPTIIKTVKWLFSLGLLATLNRALTTFTLNHGRVRHQGKGWNFENGGKGKGEVILVTGGCMGFGLNMIKMFNERAPEAKLIIIDVVELPEELKSGTYLPLSDRLSKWVCADGEAVPNLTYHKCDLTSESDIDETAATILNSTPPTVLINNAGVAKVQTVMETSQEWLVKEFTINVFCHWQLIQKCTPPPPSPHPLVTNKTPL